MVPQKTDLYLTWGDHYVAWPLSVPTAYSGWMLVSLKKSGDADKLLLVPLRPLAPEEVLSIKRRGMLYWGMKVPNAEWSLVMWRPASSSANQSEMLSYVHDPSRSIGV
jgi:hypothetical protein